MQWLGPRTPRWEESEGSHAGDLTTSARKCHLTETPVSLARMNHQGRVEGSQKGSPWMVRCFSIVTTHSGRSPWLFRGHLPFLSQTHLRAHVGSDMIAWRMLVNGSWKLALYGLPRNWNAWELCMGCFSQGASPKGQAHSLGTRTCWILASQLRLESALACGPMSLTLTSKAALPEAGFLKARPAFPWL